ncbi:MAG TPA: hypothetical protein VGI98_04385 [Candidatus Limnocylindrales bacterium]
MLTACWDGTNISMTFTWSGVNADAYGFGFTTADGGAGVGLPLPHTEHHGSIKSLTTDASLFPPLDSLTVVGGVSYHDVSVASGEISQPTGGWQTLPAC